MALLPSASSDAPPYEDIDPGATRLGHGAHLASTPSVIPLAAGGAWFDVQDISEGRDNYNRGDLAGKTG